MDLLAAAFVVLAESFFDPGKAGGQPRLMNPLPAKANTQDDPFDVRVDELLRPKLSAERGRISTVLRAVGPLISPDMVVVDWEDAKEGLEKARREGTEERPVPWAVAIEVKKVDWNPRGARVGRASGLDYNSTPPTPISRVGARGVVGTIPVPAAYLFAVLDASENSCRVVGMVVCVGSALDASDEEYLKATGERTKRIGLGSYGDGMDRIRPMYVYPNPLSADGFGTRATLVSERADLESEFPKLRRIGALRRTLSGPDNGAVDFSYYRLASLGTATEALDLVDPFQTVGNRVEQTSARGKFMLDLDLEHSASLGDGPIS